MKRALLLTCLTLGGMGLLSAEPMLIVHFGSGAFSYSGSGTWTGSISVTSVESLNNGTPVSGTCTGCSFSFSLPLGSYAGGVWNFNAGTYSFTGTSLQNPSGGTITGPGNTFFTGSLSASELDRVNVGALHEYAFGADPIETPNAGATLTNILIGYHLPTFFVNGPVDFSFKFTPPQTTSAFSSTSGQFLGGQLELDAIPEPGTMLLLGLGMTGIAVGRRFRAFRTSRS